MQLYPHQQKALDETADRQRVAYYLDMGLGILQTLTRWKFTLILNYSDRWKNWKESFRP